MNDALLLSLFTCCGLLPYIARGFTSINSVLVHMSTALRNTFVVLPIVYLFLIQCSRKVEKVEEA